MHTSAHAAYSAHITQCIHHTGHTSYNAYIIQSTH